MYVIFILVGVVLEIIKANELLIVPNTAEYIVWGSGGVLLFVQIINWFSARKQIKDISRRF